MDIIYTPVWQNPGNVRGAREFVQDEMWLMEQVEGLGFDVCASPEHHFDIEYSACPDNFMALTYLAAKTTRLKLALGAVILPWNSPLRVAEKLAMLDHLSNGRCLVGFGRGLAQMEYDHFGIEMAESRDRFDEAAAMVLSALRTGRIEGNGPHYPQAPTPIHPQPRPDLADTLLSVGMSPDSAAVAGQLGGKLLSFITKPLDGMMPLFNVYLGEFAKNHPGKTPHIVLDDFYLVRDSADEALELAMKYATAYFRTVVKHYQLDQNHFDKTKGYAAHAKNARDLQAAGVDAAAKAWVEAQMGIGSPAQVLERLEERFRVLGPEISIGGCFFYGGMSRDEAYLSLRNFSRACIPAARDMERSYTKAKAA